MDSSGGEIPLNYLKCPNCKNLFFEVPKEYAEFGIELFNEALETMTKSMQEALYGGRRASLEDYTKCECGTGQDSFIMSDLPLKAKPRLNSLTNRAAFPTLKRST